MFLTRRQFVTTALGSASLVSLSPVVPRFLLAASGEQAKASDGRVLVVVQLSGGNDGLNTVVPYGDDVYYKSRSALAIPRDQVLKIDAYAGFHPAMKGFATLLEAGRLTIVQGVGYPNPNRSHFESMDIWHTARIKPEGRSVGWLGRYLDATNRAGGDVPALHLGAEKQPLALAALNVRAPSIRTLDRFRLERADGMARQAVQQSVGAPRPAADELLSFVQESSSAALVSSRRVEEALGSYKSAVKYPETDLAGKLRTVAQLVGAGMSTRIYYVALDGFDTHSTQAQAHAGLLGQLAEAVRALYDDLSRQGNADRVLLATFSEFGRRVKENASRGTDHGAAAPMFLVGGKVKPGLIGKHPSMTDLDDGDLKHHTDFRHVYATVLDNWLGQPSEPILGERFSPLPLLAG